MKKKLNNKLSLRKETLNSLTNSEMSVLKGGYYTDATCSCPQNCAPPFSYVTYTGGTICKCQ